MFLIPLLINHQLPPNVVERTIFRFTLLMLVALFGTNLAAVLTPIQFIMLALVSMLFIPCLATLTILLREFGWKATGTIAFANIITAIFVGGIAFRILNPFF
jgi:ferrous iron transport protein B